MTRGLRRAVALLVWITVLSTTQVTVSAAATPAVSIPLSGLSIYMTSLRYGWATSGNGVLRTTDGGREWSVVTPRGLTVKEFGPCDFVPGADRYDGFGNEIMVARGRSRAWLGASCGVGTSSRIMVFRTTDGGRSWRSVTFTFPPPPSWLEVGLYFATPSVGWMTPDWADGNLAFATELFETRDGGAHWKLISRVPPTPTYILSFPSVKHGYGWWSAQDENPEGCCYSDLYGFPWTTEDGGRTWAHHRLPVPSTYANADLELGVPGFSGSESIAIPVTLVSPIRAPKAEYPPACMVYHSHDGGVHWWHTRPQKRVCGGYFFNTRDGWSRQYGPYGESGDVYRTTDGGRHWVDLGKGGPFAQALCNFITPKIGFQQSPPGPFWRTVDGGKKWKQIKPRLVNG